MVLLISQSSNDFFFSVRFRDNSVKSIVREYQRNNNLAKYEKAPTEQKSYKNLTKNQNKNIVADETNVLRMPHLWNKALHNLIMVRVTAWTGSSEQSLYRHLFIGWEFTHNPRINGYIE